MLPSDILAISSDVAEIYGVDIQDVETTVDYVISGTLGVIIPEGVPESDIISSLEEMISNVLGVHSSNVVVTMDDDQASYSVMGTSYDEMQQILNISSDPAFARNIAMELNENDFDIAVVSLTSNNDVEVVISITVDTTDATGTIDTESGISVLAETYGLTETSIDGKFFYFLFIDIRKT